jgi:hypothetical protein
VIELNLIQIAGVAIGLIIALVIVAFVVINFDVASILATSSETLTPTGTPTGRALIVYSPGLSGAAKESAAKIAKDLREKSYSVVLAGINSSAAGTGAEYDVVIVGGPVYFGRLSSSTGGYLEKLTLKSGARLGVFGTTGTGQYMEVDFKSVSEQVSSLRNQSNVPIKLILTGEVDTDCAALVSSVLGA